MVKQYIQSMNSYEEVWLPYVKGRCYWNAG
jgi:hypothetical protein